MNKKERFQMDRKLVVPLPNKNRINQLKNTKHRAIANYASTMEVIARCLK